MKPLSKLIVILLALTVILISFFGRDRTPQETPKQDTLDTISYTFDTLSIGDREDTTTKITASIQRVILSDSSQALLKISTIYNSLCFNLLLGDTLENESTFEMAFSQLYAEAVSEMLPEENWEFIQTGMVVFNRSNLFTILLTSYSFTGGAHGNQRKIYLNFNPKTGDLLTAAQLINMDSIAVLAKRAEEIFRTQIGVSPTSSLEEAGYWFQNNTFSLSQNIGITDKGLVIHYGSYEIAPYAMGPTDIIIPLEECKNWLAISLK